MTIILWGSTHAKETLKWLALDYCGICKQVSNVAEKWHRLVRQGEWHAFQAVPSSMWRQGRNEQKCRLNARAAERWVSRLCTMAIDNGREGIELDQSKTMVGSIRYECRSHLSIRSGCRAVVSTVKISNLEIAWLTSFSCRCFVLCIKQTTVFELTKLWGN